MHIKKHGVEQYMIPLAQGLEGFDFLRERPDWFCTNPDTQDFPGYTISYIKRLRNFRKRLEAAPKSEWPRFQQEMINKKMTGMPFLQLNWTRRDVLDYVIDQVIDSIRTFDVDGVRWDVGHMNTGWAWGPWKPFIDFYGKPLCNSPEEMVEQTVANIRQFKARLREVRPHFRFGTNYGGPYPLQYPKMTAELMRDGGWLLDEETRRISWPDSKYRYWKAYYEYMSDRGELMTSLGGHYNPFGHVPAKPGYFPVILMYHMIFGIAGHGHPEMYYRSKLFPIGDTAQFAVRFGRYLFDNTFRRMDAPTNHVSVSSSRPLWWEKSVLRKVEPDRQTWVMHLVNPPVEEVMEDNKTAELPDPVTGVTGSLNLPAGRTRVNAWALIAESWTREHPPVTQAVPLETRRSGDIPGQVAHRYDSAFLVVEVLHVSGTPIAPPGLDMAFSSSRSGLPKS